MIEEKMGEEYNTDGELLYKENFYGHLKRRNWIASLLDFNDEIIEVGCGTGAGITIPLMLSGYHICGCDKYKKVLMKQ